MNQRLLTQAHALMAYLIVSVHIRMQDSMYDLNKIIITFKKSKQVRLYPYGVLNYKSKNIKIGFNENGCLEYKIKFDFIIPKKGVTNYPQYLEDDSKLYNGSEIDTKKFKVIKKELKFEFDKNVTTDRNIAITSEKFELEGDFHAITICNNASNGEKQFFYTTMFGKKLDIQDDDHGNNKLRINK